jgi:hypothetical protein
MNEKKILLVEDNEVNPKQHQENPKHEIRNSKQIRMIKNSKF